jgi:Rod binding domain-containing protein
MADGILSLSSSVPSSLGTAGFSLKAGSAGATDDPDRIHHAAQQFESLMISQIMKSAHDESEGWLGTGDDQAGSSAMAIAEEQFAQALSNRGGLGLANLIEKGLTKSRNENDQ